MIDWTISLGNILTLMTLAGAIGGIYITHIRRVDHLENRVDGLKIAMEGLATAVTQIASLLTAQRVVENRLDRVEQDVRELRHGDGFTLPFHYRPSEPRE
jgi:hypothetical protein